MDRTHHTGGEEGATVPLGMNPRILGTFYTRTVQSVLTGSITSRQGNCTEQEDSEGLHPPKPLSVLTAAEREEAQKHKVQNRPVSSPGPSGRRTASSAGVSAYRPVAAPLSHRRDDLRGQSAHSFSILHSVLVFT